MASSELGPARLTRTQCVQLKDAQPDRHAWALASPHHARVRAESDQGPSLLGSCSGCLGSAPALTGASGGREPLGLRWARHPLPPRARASARDPAAAVTVAALRLPPAPLRVEPTVCGSGELPGAGAPPHAGDPCGAGRWEGLASFAAARGEQLRTCGSWGAGTRWGHGWWLTPWRAGREKEASAASFTSQTRSHPGGPDPQGPRAGGTLEETHWIRDLLLHRLIGTSTVTLSGLSSL